MDENTGKPASLTALRLKIRNDVYTRYKALKDKGVSEESARNIAAAQTATAPKARHRSAVYRRELDALLAPPKAHPRERGRGLYSTGNWRMPE